MAIRGRSFGWSSSGQQLKPVRLRPEARTDLLNIATYLHRERERSSIEFRQTVKRTFELLSSSPDTGILIDHPLIRLKGIRRFVLAKPFQNYLVFYRHLPTEVQVLRLLHGARDFPTLFDHSDL